MQTKAKGRLQQCAVLGDNLLSLNVAAASRYALLLLLLLLMMMLVLLLVVS